MQSCLTFGNSRILAETFEVVGHEGKVEKEEDEEAKEEEEEDEGKVENVSDFGAKHMMPIYLHYLKKHDVNPQIPET